MSVQTFTLFSNINILAGGSVYSTPIDVSNLDGFCSLFLQSNYSSTSGTVTIIYELSNDNINWSQEATAPIILASFTKTSGPAADGKIFIAFAVPVAAWSRLKVTETGTADPVQITVVLSCI